MLDIIRINFPGLADSQRSWKRESRGGLLMLHYWDGFCTTCSFSNFSESLPNPGKFILMISSINIPINNKNGPMIFSP